MNIVTHEGERKSELPVRDNEGLLREVVKVQCKNQTRKKEGNQRCEKNVCERACLCACATVKNTLSLLCE